MIIPAGVLPGKYQRFARSRIFARRIVGAACMLGLVTGLVVALLSGPEYEASTVLAPTDSIDPASLVASIDKHEIAQDMLREIDVTDDRLTAVFPDSPFSRGFVDPQNRIVEALNISSAGDSIMVSFRSLSRYEAQHLSILASYVLRRMYIADRNASDPEFAATLSTLIDQREQLADSLNDFSPDPENMAVAARLEVETLRQLQDRLVEKDISKSLLEVVSEPNSPLPVDQANMLLLIAGFGLGFTLLSSVLLVVARSLSPSVISRDDVQANFDWHGELKYFNTSSKHGPESDRLFLKPSQSHGTTDGHPLAGLAGHLLAKQTLPQAIVVGGPDEKVGKTLVALNLAALLSRVGLQVLLIDSDAVQRKLSTALDADTSRGFRDVLWGEASLSTVIRKSAKRCFDFLPAGTSPYGLLPVIRELGSVLELLTRSYDVIIIDEGREPMPFQASGRDALVCVLAVTQSARADANHYLSEREAISTKMLVLNEISPGAESEETDWVRSSRIPFRLAKASSTESMKLVEKAAEVPVSRQIESLLSQYRQTAPPESEEKAVS